MTDENKQPSINLHRTFVGLAKLLLKFNLNFDYFFKTLREYYVREADKAGINAIRTALKSNIDRRLVTTILKNIKPYYKPLALPIIFDQIKIIAKKDNITDKMAVAKYGKDSIESIILDVSNGSATVNAIVEELLVLGCITDLGDRIKYLDKPIAHTEKQIKALSDFSDQIENYVDEMLVKLKL